MHHARDAYTRDAKPVKTASTTSTFSSSARREAMAGSVRRRTPRLRSA
ncbi:Hypothetical protein A7982_06510 [Minicystis rosea]|nr:Hypothetical protein A7982_06510 [Minicystis rosea]